MAKPVSPNKIAQKREREKRMVSQMIKLYCQKNHATHGELCAACAQLEQYARERSERCPLMETKTFCSNCRVHCYKPTMRQKIREVMRFSGPRMLLRHPIATISHLMQSLREKKHLEMMDES